MFCMKTKLVALSIMCALVTGCSTSDPPCPPRALNVSDQEADEGLIRKATQEAKANRGDDISATFNCGYDAAGNGVYKDIGQTQLSFLDVLWCAQEIASSHGGSLGLCLERLARGKYTDQILGNNAPPKIAMTFASHVDCVEASRNVDVKADKHTLHRDDQDEWVPAILLTGLHLAGRAGTAAAGAMMAPALFVIRLAAGEERTCLDTPHGPSSGCLDEGGCPDVPPGAEVPSASTGGDVIPPRTDPGTPGGDHL